MTDDRYGINRNSEGYVDPTAYAALKAISAEEKVEKKAAFLIAVLKFIIREAGFEPEERIILRHRQTGRIFR